TPCETACASIVARNSSTVTSRLGPEWRSGASGRSRRMTCAWQSTAAISDNWTGASRPRDNGFSALAVFGLELGGREEALFELLHVVDAHDVVQFLEGDQRVWAIDDLAGVERFLEVGEAALHAAQRAR